MIRKFKDQGRRKKRRKDEQMYWPRQGYEIGSIPSATIGRRYEGRKFPVFIGQFVKRNGAWGRVSRRVCGVVV